MFDDNVQDKLVTIFASRTVSAEIEAETIHGLPESSGIGSLIVRENVVQAPVGLVSIKVLDSEEQEARAIIESARDAGESGSDSDDEAQELPE